MKKKILSKEEQIAQIQKKLAENPPARDFAALTRTLGLLTGAIKTYARNKADQNAQPQEQPSTELPSHWPADHWRILVMENACGTGNAFGHPQWGLALQAKEREWAKREGLTVEQLREDLRRQDAKYKAQHSDEERLAMSRAHLESLRHPDSVGTSN